MDPLDLCVVFCLLKSSFRVFITVLRHSAESAQRDLNFAYEKECRYELIRIYISANYGYLINSFRIIRSGSLSSNPFDTVVMEIFIIILCEPPACIVQVVFYLLWQPF